MNLYMLLIGITALGLSACEAATNAGDNSSATEKETSSSAKPARNNKGDTKLEKPSKSLDEAMALDAFGVSLNMPVEQVKTILLEKGFAEPHFNRMSDLVDTFEASIGYNCAFKYRGTNEGICDKIGQVQQEGYVWTRGPDIDGEAEERLLPLFYVDEAKSLRLWHMGYERSYDPEIFPGNIAEQMIERFGAPTIHNSDETFEYLSYYIQMPVPAGYKRTESDDRSASDFSEQRAITTTRLECLKDEVENLPKPRSRSCKAIMDKPAKPQYLFDALGANQFLDINVQPDELRLDLTGRFLFRAVEYAVQETELKEALAELARRRDAEADVADDL